jgi:hypothetical protein
MRRSLVVAAALAVGAVIAVSAASAGEAINVSGTYTATDFGSTDCAPVGASGFMLRCSTTGFVSEYSGDLEGAAVADFTELIDCKTSRAVGIGTETFTGSVRGVGSGTLTYTDQFSSDIDCTSFVPMNLDLDSVAVKGSGGLAGLQGKLHFTDTTYSGTLR